jgi:calcineurin-like phosphoesterase family protein
LNGKYRLIAGNHDERLVEMIQGGSSYRDDQAKILSKFEWVKETYFIRNAKGHVLAHLHHYPIGSWLAHHKGTYMLHGHSHGQYRRSIPMTFDGGRIIDMGIDCHNYRPVPWERVCEILDVVTVYNHDNFEKRATLNGDRL